MAEWKKVYSGVEITVNDHGRFVVNVGEKGEEEEFPGFDTYERATSFIDRLSKAKIQTEREKLSLEVITEHGKIEHITGVNMASRDFLGVEKVKLNDYSSRRTVPYVYAIADWVHEDLERRKVVANELREIESRLEMVEIKRVGYGRISPEEYPNIIARLKKSHSNKTALASNGRPKVTVTR